MNASLPAPLSQLEETVGYCFKNKSLLQSAMTHASYFNEHKNGLPHNERLEFLGDAVLSAITAEFLFRNDRGDEGDLSRTRSALVKTDALCSYAREINLGKYLYLGKGEEKEGRSNPTNLEDAFEALVAALYLDGGKEVAAAFVLPYINKYYAATHNHKDNKSRLQEIVQKSKTETLSYELLGETGPDHKKTFTCGVYINSNLFAQGEGRSIKAAEEDAAGKALLLLGETP